MWFGWSGGGLEGDFVAEGFELADVAALAALGVDAGGVEPWPQVGEPGLRVREQVPGDDQDGAADRDVGALGAAAPGDAPVPLAEECVGLGGACGGVSEHGSEVGVPWPAVLLPFFFPADSFTPGARRAQDTR
jgi:hypothetical protein